jgi:hypothetical protein
VKPCAWQSPAICYRWAGGRGSPSPDRPFERVVDPVLFDGVVGFGARARLATVPPPEPIGADELLHPLLEYERLVGGCW